MKHGFGVSAAVDPDLIGSLAAAAEQAGYATFWVNDVPGGNGLEQLKRAQEATSAIRLGVGVLPVDRWTADQIVATIRRLVLDDSRLDLGIGAGTLHKGSLEATRACLVALRPQTTARILVGALGPKMVGLGASEADGVILNWLTPAAASELSATAREAAAAAGKPSTHVVAYVRTAATPEADERLQVESAAYEGYPSYKRHFDRMGVRAIETTVSGKRHDIAARYAQYAGAVAELVCRAIVPADTLSDYLEVLATAAPESSGN